MTRLLVLAALVAAVGGSTASAQPSAARAACKPGVHTVHGEFVKVFCGPAKAVVHFGGTTMTFQSGRCSMPAYFHLDLGTLTISGPAQSTYLGLAANTYDDGTYRSGQDGGAIVVHIVFQYAGKDQPTYKDTLTLRGNLTRGTFSGRLGRTGGRFYHRMLPPTQSCPREHLLWLTRSQRTTSCTSAKRSLLISARLADGDGVPSLSL